MSDNILLNYLGLSRIII